MVRSVLIPSSELRNRVICLWPTDRMNLGQRQGIFWGLRTGPFNKKGQKVLLESMAYSGVPCSSTTSIYMRPSLCWIKRTRNSEYRLYVLFPCLFVESFLLRRYFRLKSFIGKFSLKVFGRRICLSESPLYVTDLWSVKSKISRTTGSIWERRFM
jgi:hypothetical protein